MKNNKGISLIALIVMIIVMIILAAIAMNAQNNFHKYLTAHCADTMESHESAIGILYDFYAESNEGDNPQIRATLKKLRNQLTTTDTDNIMTTVFELC